MTMMYIVYISSYTLSWIFNHIYIIIYTCLNKSEYVLTYINSFCIIIFFLTSWPSRASCPVAECSFSLSRAALSKLACFRAYFFLETKIKERSFDSCRAQPWASWPVFVPFVFLCIWDMGHMHESRPICTSHVPYARVTSHMHESRPICMSHVP